MPSQAPAENPSIAPAAAPLHDFARLTAALEAAQAGAADAPPDAEGHTDLTLDLAAALARHLAATPPEDRAWALHLLAGHRPKAALKPAGLRAAVLAVSGHEDWMFEACLPAIGDTGETAALLLPPPAQLAQRLPQQPEPPPAAHPCLADLLARALPALRAERADPQRLAAALLPTWAVLDSPARVLLHALSLGQWRSPLPRPRLQAALALLAGVTGAVMAQRLQDWGGTGPAPDAAALDALLAGPPDSERPTVAELDAGPGEGVTGDPSEPTAPDRAADSSSDPRGAATPSLRPECGRAPGEALPFAVVVTTRQATPDAGRAGEETDHGALQRPLALDMPVPNALEAAVRQALVEPPSTHVLQWSYPGLRLQLVRHGDAIWVWARDGSLLNAELPNLVAAAGRLSVDATLELMLVAEAEVETHAEAQPPTDDHTVNPAIGTAEQAPAGLLPRSSLLASLRRRTGSRSGPSLRVLALDLLEHRGTDLRAAPVAHRQTLLATLWAPLIEPITTPSATRCRTRPAAARPALGPLAPCLHAPDAKAFQVRCGQAEAAGLRGVVARSAHAVLLQWLPPARTARAVLVHVQPGPPGQDRAPGLCSVAVWSRPPTEAEVAAVSAAIARREPAAAGDLALVTLVQLEPAWSAADARRIAQQVKAGTLARHGPVRSLAPALVVELAYDRAEASARHASGLRLTGARALRLREDLPVTAADTLEPLLRIATALAPRPAS